MAAAPWVWNNTTQVVFGENAVVDHMKDFVKPNSKVLCTFGGGSIDKNGARKDVQKELDDLHCEVRSEECIQQTTHTSPSLIQSTQ